jgi:transposase
VGLEGAVPQKSRQLELPLKWPSEVLGKKNWLFVGHDESGARTAAILTIVATCVSHDLNPRAYLHLVTKLILAGWPNKKLRDLLPDRIAVSHPEVLAKYKPAPTAAVLMPSRG